MMKKLTALMFVLLSLLATSIIALPARASAKVAAGCGSDSILKLPTWYEYLDVGPKVIKDKNNYVTGTDKCAIIGPPDSNGNIDWAKGAALIGLAIVDILLRLAGIIAVGFVIYGGFRLMITEGEPERFKTAKDAIFNAIIGLLIVLVSTAAVNFVGRTLIK